MKKRLLINSPFVGARGQYTFLGPPPMGSTIQQSNAISPYADKFSKTSLYSRVMESRINDLIVNKGLYNYTTSFFRIDHFKVFNSGVDGELRNLKYHIYMMDQTRWSEVWQAEYADGDCDFLSGKTPANWWLDEEGNPDSDYCEKNIPSTYRAFDNGDKAERIYYKDHDSADKHKIKPDDGYALRDNMIINNLRRGSNSYPSYPGDSSYFNAENAFAYCREEEAAFVFCEGQKLHIFVDLYSDADLKYIADEHRPDVHYQFELDANSFVNDDISTFSFTPGDSIHTFSTGPESILTPNYGVELEELKFTIAMASDTIALPPFLTDEEQYISERLAPADILNLNNFDETFLTQQIGQQIDALDFDNYDSYLQDNFEPVAKVKILNEPNYDLQAYQLSITDSQICSAPNQIELDFYKTSIYDVDTDLSEEDLSFKLAYKFFVVSWDDRDDQFDSVEDFLQDFPIDVFGLTQKRIENIYNFSNIGRPLISNYSTPGLKTIKSVLFTHTIPEFSGTNIQIVRWKFITSRIFLDIPAHAYPDFGDLGGSDFITIPWPHTTPVIGGSDENSIYNYSLNDTLGSGNVGDTDVIDERFLIKARKNDELGQSIKIFDLEQVRYFTTGSYDMHRLLGIQNDIVIGGNFYPHTDISGSLTQTSGYWDGEINTFSQETPVDKIFISDTSDPELIEDCALELNCGDLDGKVISDSSGNINKGILIGDYKIKKTQKGTSMRRDSAIKTPKKNNNEDGAL